MNDVYVNAKPQLHMDNFGQQPNVVNKKPETSAAFSKSAENSHLEGHSKTKALTEYSIRDKMKLHNSAHNDRLDGFNSGLNSTLDSKRSTIDLYSFESDVEDCGEGKWIVTVN